MCKTEINKENNLSDAELERLASELQDLLNDKYLCKVIPVQKNNYIRKGISVKLDSRINMILYPETDESAFELRSRFCQELLYSNIDEDFLQKVFVDVYKYLRIGLTSDPDYVKNTVCRKIADLYEYLYIVYEADAENNYFLKVSPTMLSSMADGFAVAHLNMEKEALLSPVTDMLSSISMGTEKRNLLEMSVDERTELSENEVPMFVITGKQTAHGAAYALVPKVQSAIQQIFPDGYYLIPSATSEMLAVPKDWDIEDLRGVVMEMNRGDAIKKEEILSDNVYLFENGTLVVAK